jgi:hypothetical protein
MKHNQIADLPKIGIENLENIFNIHQDENGVYYYNLLQTIVLPDLPPNLFDEYIIKPGDSWPFISFKTLQNVNLWWLILLANNIDNPTSLPVPGTTIKIPITEVVKEVLLQMRK